MADELSKSIQSTEHELSWANRKLRGDSADDVKELCDAIEQCQQLEALRLEGNTINEAAATAIGQALEKHSEIQRLIWNDLFTTRLKTEVPQSLIQLTQGLITNNCHIVELNLSDNAFGPIGVDGLKIFLSSSACYTLEELRLNNCGMGIGGGQLLAEALLACHENSNGKFALKLFIAGRNRLENEGSQALANAFSTIGTLEVIRMPQNGIRPPGIEALANAFVENANLRIIDLNDNTITLAAGRLASVIEKLSNLEIIDLYSSLIRTQGAVAIARAIVSHKNLQELHLACNEIHIEGAMEIAHSVKNMPNLRVLDLNGNNFGLDGVEEIRDCLKNTSFVNKMVFDNDEGSDNEDGGNGEDYYDNERNGDEDEDDDDENYEDDDDEDESPSFFFGNNEHTNRIQPSTLNNFQFQFNNQSNMNRLEPVDDLSSVLANLTTCSPFNFILQNNENQWRKLTNLDQMKQYIQSDEQSIDRAIQLLDDLWKETSISSDDCRSIASNLFRILKFHDDSERMFNERLSVILGFVKDERTGRQHQILNRREKIYENLVDIHQLLPNSTKYLLSVFLENAPNKPNSSTNQLERQLLTLLKQ